MRPYWIPGTKNFWFRKTNAPDSPTFFCVDPCKRLCQPAFDHDAVAQALRQESIDASPTSLPFDRIDVDSDGAAVRFRAGERTWEWKQNGGLARFSGKMQNTVETLKPLASENHTVESRRKTVINFDNRTGDLVSVYWVDPEGKKKYYRDVKARRVATQHTYEGHIWRVTRSREGSAIASFAATFEERTAVIEEGLVPAEPFSRTSAASHEQQDTAAANGPGLFLKGNDVWLREIGGGETQLSTTGTDASPFDSAFFYPEPDGDFSLACIKSRMRSPAIESPRIARACSI